MVWVYLNKAVLPITQTDTTWRRGCVTGTGMDLVSDLETQRLPAPDTLGAVRICLPLIYSIFRFVEGCVEVGERIEAEFKVVSDDRDTALH